MKYLSSRVCPFKSNPSIIGPGKEWRMTKRALQQFEHHCVFGLCQLACFYSGPVLDFVLLIDELCVLDYHSLTVTGSGSAVRLGRPDTPNDIINGIKLSNWATA